MFPGNIARYCCPREHECCPGMLMHWATLIIYPYHVMHVGPITIAYFRQWYNNTQCLLSSCLQVNCVQLLFITCTFIWTMVSLWGCLKCVCVGVCVWFRD